MYPTFKKTTLTSLCWIVAIYVAVQILRYSVVSQCFSCYTTCDCKVLCAWSQDCNSMTHTLVTHCKTSVIHSINYTGQVRQLQITDSKNKFCTNDLSVDATEVAVSSTFFSAPLRLFSSGDCGFSCSLTTCVTGICITSFTLASHCNIKI